MITKPIKTAPVRSIKRPVTKTPSTPLSLENPPFTPWNGIYFRSDNPDAALTTGDAPATVGDEILKILNHDLTRTSNSKVAGSYVELVNVPGIDFPLWEFNGTGGFSFNARGSEFEGSNIPSDMTFVCGFMVNDVNGSSAGDYIFGMSDSAYSNRNWGMMAGHQTRAGDKNSTVNWSRNSSVGAIQRYPSPRHDISRVGQWCNLIVHVDQDAGNAIEWRYNESEALSMDSDTGQCFTPSWAFDRLNVGHGNDASSPIRESKVTIAYFGMFPNLDAAQRATLQAWFNARLKPRSCLLIGDSRMESVQSRTDIEDLLHAEYPWGVPMIANAGDRTADQLSAYNTYVVHGYRNTDAAILVGVNDMNAGIDADTAFGNWEDIADDVIAKGGRVHAERDYFLGFDPQNSTHQAEHDDYRSQVTAYCTSNARATEINKRDEMMDGSSSTEFDTTYSADGIHFNSTGYDVHNAAIAESLQ